MTTPDNRALWELVDSLRESANVDWSTWKNKDWAEWVRDCAKGSAAGKRHAADELAAILERPVVVDRTHLEALEMIRDWPDETAEAMGYEIAFHALKAMAKAVTTDYTRTLVYSESMVRGKS